MNQEKIWEHFQTTAVASFASAMPRYKTMVKEVQRHRPRQASTQPRVLNIGIGPGILERQLRALGWSVSSLDISEKTAEQLRADGFDAHCGYAQEMPFPDGSFDVVVASEVLEHIEDKTRIQVIVEIRRVLRPGGVFVGSVPFCEDLLAGQVICPDCGKVFHRWGHVASFEMADIAAELSRELVVTACRKLTFIDWSEAKNPVRLVTLIVKSVLGRLGSQIAYPSIVFNAQKPLKR